MLNRITNYLQFILLFSIGFILFASCQKRPREEWNAETSEATNVPIIVTTIAPYKFLLQELAGNYIEILNTSEQSADPHILDLTPQQVIQLQMAELFLSLNPIEERLILKSLGEQTKVVEMWHGFPRLNAMEEGHGHEEKEGWDGHFWLSPAALPIQIETMARELEAFIPAQKELLQINKENLLQRSQDFTEQLRSSLPQLQNGKILSFHSALAYFADFFNAEQIAVEGQGVKLGSDEMLHLFENVKELTFPVLITSPQFEQEKAKALAKQLNLGVVEFDPLYPDIFESLLNLAGNLSREKN